MKAQGFIAIVLFLTFSMSCSRHDFEAKANPRISAFLKHYNEEKFAEAAKLFRNGNPLVKPEENVPLDQLEANFSMFHAFYGDALELDDAGSEVAVDTERGKEYVVVKAGRFEKGEGTIDFIFTVWESDLHLRYVAFGGPLAAQLMQGRE